MAYTIPPDPNLYGPDMERNRQFQNKVSGEASVEAVARAIRETPLDLGRGVDTFGIVFSEKLVTAVAEHVSAALTAQQHPGLGNGGPTAQAVAEITRLRTVLRFVADHITQRPGFDKPDPVFLRSMIEAALTEATGVVPATTPSASKWKPDWSRPIQFANGQSCSLIETKEPGGFGQFPEATRMIQRDGVEVPQAAFWFVPENGRTSWPEEDGFFIVNRAALTTPSAPIPTEDHEPRPAMLVDNEWLRRKIEADPDLDAEAGTPPTEDHEQGARGSEERAGGEG